MGRTTQTISMFLDHVEHAVFGRFTQACTPSEQRLIRKLFSNSRQHIAAINMTGHLLPFESALMAMMLEQQRSLEAIRAALESLEA
ncbi:MAG: hypothetical protein KF698_08230 [Anaerolineales bacterium]|nr:hypothetical protein [Anaerolineales bacterium]